VTDAGRPHAGDLVFEYPDARAARLVADAVAVEAGEIEGDRTAARVCREDATLRVAVRADDLVALRAGLNTWTSLVEVAERVAGAR